MTITCFIRYRIDPFQREQFRQYAENWGRIIPRCGGEPDRLFSPATKAPTTRRGGWSPSPAWPRTKRIARALRTDPESRANFALAQEQRFILREERTFTEAVEGTLQRSAP